MGEAGFYPESGLRERIKVAYEWIPEKCERLLDGGCAYGAGTRHFKRKSAATWGIEPNPDLIAVARARSPDITFVQCGLESTPFEPNFFDVIVLNDVLEHVPSEKAALDEMHRILAPGGVLIITTPHAGVFSFLDPDNYAFHVRARFPGLYRWVFQRKYGKPPPAEARPGYDQLHRHYRLSDFKQMLESSRFYGGFTIEALFRGGLLAGVMTSNLQEVFSLGLGVPAAWRLLAPLRWVADIDYLVPYGALSYNIGIKVKKVPSAATLK
jgi:ubiquinone/menaquinone biosynthesis C-methylase UbiE